MKHKLLRLGTYLNYSKTFPVVIIWDFVLKCVSSFDTSSWTRIGAIQRGDQTTSALEVVQQDPHKAQQRQMPSSVSWKEQPLARGEAGAGWRQSSFAGQDLGVPGGEQVSYGPAVCPCSRSLGHVSTASRSRNKQDIEIQQRSLGWLGPEAWSVGGAAQSNPV